MEVTSKRLKEIVSESIVKVLSEETDKIPKVEDFFDIKSLSKQDVLSIANDLRVFIINQGFNSDITTDGNLIVKEGNNLTMPIKLLRTELKKLGFKNWQVKSQVQFNKVRVVVLYVDLDKNSEIVENKMLSCGWTRAFTTPVTNMFGIPVRVMGFDPKEQKSLTKEARKYVYLYHWTPYGNVQSILRTGIEARNENDFLSYPPKVHLMKGDTPKSYASQLGWHLFNKNNSLYDGHYALLRITTQKIPENVEFYGDPRSEYGYFTKDTIPPHALELFGEIIFSDKYNYNNEKIKVLVNNDTMVG